MKSEQEKQPPIKGWAVRIVERTVHSREQNFCIILLFLLSAGVLTPIGLHCIRTLQNQELSAVAHGVELFVFLTVFILLLLFSYILVSKRYITGIVRQQIFYSPKCGSPLWPKWVNEVPALLAKNGNAEYVYVYLDIKNFKYINDLYGYDLGDELLHHMSTVLRKSIGPEEAYVRVMADKFSLLLHGGSDEEIENRLDSIRKEIRNFHGLSSMIRIYFGVYRIADPTMELSQMSDRALLTMKSIKNNPRKGCHVAFYNEKYRQSAVLERELEGEMEAALQNKEFVVYLQPKFDLHQQRVIGAEALIRWQHPTRGMLPPGSFISLFESSGMITQLDCYVFREVCEMFSRWRKEGRELLPVSVNLSRMALYHPALPQELFAITQEYQIPASYLELELTENSALEDAELLTRFLKGLKKYGFMLSIDDFGSGYSSLNILKDINVDVLKLDREFFTHAENEGRSQQVITSVVELAKKLQMKTVAEGVEQKTQAEFLAGISCDIVQGYYFSRPIPVGEYEGRYLPSSCIIS